MNKYNEMGNTTLFSRKIKFNCFEIFMENLALLQYLCKIKGTCFNEIAVIYNKKEMVLTFVWTSLNHFRYLNFYDLCIDSGSVSDIETREDNLELKDIPSREDLESDLRDGEFLLDVQIGTRKFELDNYLVSKIKKVIENVISYERYDKYLIFCSISDILFNKNIFDSSFNESDLDSSKILVGVME